MTDVEIKNKHRIFTCIKEHQVHTGAEIIFATKDYFSGHFPYNAKMEDFSYNYIKGNNSEINKLNKHNKYIVCENKSSIYVKRIK